MKAGAFIITMTVAVIFFMDTHKRVRKICGDYHMRANMEELKEYKLLELYAFTLVDTKNDNLRKMLNKLIERENTTLKKYVNDMQHITKFYAIPEKDFYQTKLVQQLMNKLSDNISFKCWYDKRVITITMSPTNHHALQFLIKFFTKMRSEQKVTDINNLITLTM